MPFEEIFAASKSRKDDGELTIRIVLLGRVQNVGMRTWIRRRANKFGMNGWVRNRKGDESVEAMINGPADDVREFIQICYQGPSFAYVKKLKEFPVVEEKIPKGFYILPSI